MFNTLTTRQLMVEIYLPGTCFLTLSVTKDRIQFLVFTGIDRTINNDFFCSIVGVRGYLLDHSGDEGNTAGLISREYYFLRGPSA